MLAWRSVTENSCQKVARLWSLVLMARPLINHLIHLKLCQIFYARQIVLDVCLLRSPSVLLLADVTCAPQGRKRERWEIFSSTEGEGRRGLEVSKTLFRLLLKNKSSFVSYGIFTLQIHCKIMLEMLCHSIFQLVTSKIPICCEWLLIERKKIILYVLCESASTYSYISLGPCCMATQRTFNIKD